MKELRPGQRLERIVAKLTNGKLTRGSGSGTQKGDIQTEKWLIECKDTIHSCIPLERQWFIKLEEYITYKDLLLVIGLSESKDLKVFTVDSKVNIMDAMYKENEFWISKTIDKYSSKLVLPGKNYYWKLEDDLSIFQDIQRGL